MVGKIVVGKIIMTFSNRVLYVGKNINILYNYDKNFYIS